MLKQLSEIGPCSRLFASRQDRKLLSEFQNGTIDSFSPFYSRYSKPIHKYVLKHIRTVAVAEELTQDIFLKVYQHRKSYDPKFEVSTWIWTIAKNTIYDYLRQSRTEAACFQPPSASSDASQKPLMIESVSTETAETLMIEEYEKRKLMELMTTLSSQQKKAIFLRLVKRFSYQEISKSMNISLSAVKSLINRGKASLIQLNSKLNSGKNFNISQVDCGVRQLADIS